MNGANLMQCVPCSEDIWHPLRRKRKQWESIQVVQKQSRNDENYSHTYKTPLEPKESKLLQFRVSKNYPEGMISRLTILLMSSSLPATLQFLKTEQLSLKAYQKKKK
jgi:hypothetical protein